MKKKSSPSSVIDDLWDRTQKVLAGTGPDRDRRSAGDVRRLVEERRAHQEKLDRQHKELGRARETIAELRSRCEALYDLAPVGYVTLNRAGQILQVNPAGAGLLGGLKNSLVDQPIHLWLAPESRDAFGAHLQQVFTVGGQQTCELKILRPDGAHLHILMESTAQPAAGEPQGCCHAVISDITARRQAEAELALKEKLLDGASDSIFLHDLDGNFLYVNEAACKDRGYEKDELLGQNLAMLVTPEFARKRASLLDELMAKGEIIFESANRRKDGSVMPVEIHARTINLSDRPLILSVARDITERQRADQENRLNEARLTSLLRISQYESESIQDLLDFALHEAIALTGSKIGYIYFYNDETQQFVLNSWSKEVMAACSVVEQQTVYELEKTGLWGEAVRQAKPIVVNDFQAAHPLKQGYPEGHAPLVQISDHPRVPKRPDCRGGRGSQ